MDILEGIIQGIVMFCVYSCVLVFFYAVYRGRNLDREPILGIIFLNETFFVLCCLFGLIIFLEAGFERALFFIPHSWGYTDDAGNWESIKDVLSYTLASVAAIGLLVKIHRIRSKERK
jgi:hypothetical protein